MSVITAEQPVTTVPAPPPAEKRTRQPRLLSTAEQKVAAWVKENHGTLARIARQCEVSVQFVFFIAYNRGERKSQGLRVERALKSMGCPLIQKLR